MYPSKVYFLTNTVNDKVYVGISSQKYVSQRWGKHKQCAREGKDTHLYRAIRKYGEDKFSWNVVAEFPTVSEAKNAEKLWIILLRSNESEFGYNTTLGGEAPKHSEETKKKISEIQLLNPKPKEFYVAISASTKTPEALAAHSEKMKKAWADGKFDNKVRTIQSKDPERTARLKSQTLLEGYASGRIKRRTGIKASEETKAKMRESQRKRFLIKAERAA